MSTTRRTPVYVTRSGMTVCASCTTHYKLEGVAMTTTRCPFCQTTLGVSSRTPDAEQGAGAMRRLNRGKSGLMLAALGVSLSLAACTQKTPEATAVDPAPPFVETSTPSPEDAAAPSLPDMQPEEDSSAHDMAEEDAAEALLVRPASETVAVPKYGLPPSHLQKK